MEADSTTVENDCYDFIEAGRESPLVDELLRYEGFFQNVVKPLLRKEENGKLISWMKDYNLIRSRQTCILNSPGCEMIWTSARVVDRFQWMCKNCNRKLPIRENSFFKFVYCTFSVCFKILLAWSQDLDIGSVATAFGIKKPVVSKIYDKIEKVVAMRTPTPLGGPGSVVLVEFYPDTIGEQLQPDSSKNDSSPIQKPHYKILCIADTTKVPTRFSLHLITGYSSIQTENNNTKVVKANLHQEIMNILNNNIAPGGFCAIGGGKQLITVYEELKQNQKFEGVVKTNTLIQQTNSELKTFIIHDIWKWALNLCDAALELPRDKIESYLSVSTWRREFENDDIFLALVKLLARHDHTKKFPKKKKSKTS